MVIPQNYPVPRLYTLLRMLQVAPPTKAPTYDTFSGFCNYGSLMLGVFVCSDKILVAYNGRLRFGENDRTRHGGRQKIVQQIRREATRVLVGQTKATGLAVNQIWDFTMPLSTLSVKPFHARRSTCARSSRILSSSKVWHNQQAANQLAPLETKTCIRMRPQHCVLQHYHHAQSNSAAVSVAAFVRSILFVGQNRLFVI